MRTQFYANYFCFLLDEHLDSYLSCEPGPIYTPRILFFLCVMSPNIICAVLIYHAGFEKNESCTKDTA